MIRSTFVCCYNTSSIISALKMETVGRSTSDFPSEGS
jgi:hypothetical protein